MRYSTFVFDLDGTLLNTLDDLAASVNYALRSHGLPQRTLPEVRSFLGNGIRYLMEKSVGNGATGAKFEEVFNAFRAHYVEHCLDRTQPYGGIMEVLKEFKRRGIKMAIVSNKLDPAVQELNERFFNDYISVAVGESATVRRKPNPDAVLKSLKDLQSAADKAVYVGDSEVDLQTAKNAGLPCVLVLWGFRDRDFLESLPGAEHFAAEPNDLLHFATGGED